MEAGGVEGEAGGGLGLALGGLDGAVLVVPYADGFVLAGGGDEGFADADVHADYGA